MRAGEIVGQTALAGVWLKTKPLPWYSLYTSYGTTLELLLLISGATYSKLFPAKLNETEELLNHAGETLCVQTASELVFIASSNRVRPRELTHELHRFSLSTLISCDYDYPRTTKVKLEFESSEPVTLHFVGDENDLTGFVSRLEISEKPEKVTP